MAKTEQDRELETPILDVFQKIVNDSEGRQVPAHC